MKDLTVAQVAHLRGTGRVAAWRWLSRNGGRHFRRKGRFRVISSEVYRRLTLDEHVDDKIAKLAAMFAEDHELLVEVVRRVDALAQRVARMRDR